MSKESFARGFCKVAEAHGIDPMALASLMAHTEEHAIKTASVWDSIKEKIDAAAASYAQMSEGSRLAMNTVGGGLAGAGIGALAGKKGKKGIAALIGALAGGSTGAIATKALSAPDWFKLMAIRGTKERLTGNLENDDSVGRKLLRWLASNEKGKARDALNEAADNIGKPGKFRLPWWNEGEYIETPPSHFDIDSLYEATGLENNAAQKKNIAAQKSAPNSL